MRLTCPNCGAQYEVPDGVIPQDGRDVQCSNCGDTWYQYHPDFPPEIAEDDGSEEGFVPPAGPPPSVEPDPAPEPGPDVAETEPPSAEATGPEPQGSVQETDTAPPAETPTETPSLAHGEDDDALPEVQGDLGAPPVATRRRKIDPAVRDVLREEAAHEQQARTKDRGGLESQPELGLSGPEREQARRDREAQARRDREAQARMARLRGQSEPEAADAGEKPKRGRPAADAESGSSRRDLLPDIDEINSTLRSKSDPEEDDGAMYAEEQERAGRRGYRRGFFLVLILAALGLAFYAMAEDIKAQLPQFAGIVDGYVDGVDEARLWLDRMARRAVEWLETTTGSGEA